MPKRTDLRTILILGSGPIRIGQACEFDYSGAQACRVLRREGYRVVLVNSNPATIMTDPEWADATYLEPLTLDHLCDGLGVELAPLGVELIGARVDAIRRAEDRLAFRETARAAGLPVAESRVVTSASVSRSSGSR